MSEVSGIRFPFRFAAAGGVRTVTGIEKVESNLRALVKTTLGERLVRKGVGTVGYALVLRNLTSDTEVLVKTLLREGILKHERKAIVTDILLSTTETRTGTGIVIDVHFIYRDTGEAGIASVTAS